MMRWTNEAKGVCIKCDRAKCPRTAPTGVPILYRTPRLSAPSSLTPGPTEAELSNYDSVIWFCGDASHQVDNQGLFTPDTQFWAGPDTADRLALTNWLNTGDKTLVMACQEFAYDWIDYPDLGLSLNTDVQAWIQQTLGIGNVVDIACVNFSSFQVRNPKTWWTSPLNQSTAISACVEELGLSTVRMMFNLPDDMQNLDSDVNIVWRGHINETGGRSNHRTPDGSPIGCEDLSFPHTGDYVLGTHQVKNTSTSPSQTLYIGFHFEWSAESSRLGAWLDPYLPDTCPKQNCASDNGGTDERDVALAVSLSVIFGCCCIFLLCLCCVVLLVLGVVAVLSCFGGVVGWQFYKIKKMGPDASDGADMAAL